MATTRQLVTFSVHEYDTDGDIDAEGVYLHFGNTKIWICDNLEDFGKFAKTIKEIEKELEDNRQEYNL